MGLLGFFYYFPVENFKIPNWLKNVFWLVTLVLVGVTMFTPWVDKMETPTAAGPVVTLGDGYYFYLAHVFLLPVMTLVLGAFKNFTLKGLNRLRFEYSFWVFVPTIIAFLVSNLILPIFGIIDQFVWSPVFLFPIVISSFYAIAKYRFLDIRLILARAVAFVIFIFFCIGIYALFLFFVVQKFLGVQIDLVIAGAALVLAIFTALSFQPILTWLRKITNVIFYKNHYNREKLLAQLTHVMANTIDLETMTTSILEILNQEMHLTKSAFVILEDNKLSESFTKGYKKNDLLDKKFGASFYKYIKTKSIFIFDELPETGIKNFFRDYDISIVIPIKVKNVTVAVLILGSKLSGEIYDSQDIDFLNLFASESGIAIQNAQSFEQIKKFNVLLEKKVEERTSELKKSQQRELAKAQDIARLKDEFVFIASHELRAPVTAIKGFIELVSDSAKNLPKDVKENLEYISAASGHLSQLINDLLEISRNEAGTVQIFAQPTNIVPIIQSIIQEVTPQATKENVKLNLKVDSKVGLALVDDKKINEVLMNIINNAVKYNRKGGKVDIKVFSDNTKLTIDVTDTGYGIPKDQQDRIFQKFFRAQNEKTSEVLGTGLGLFITRMLVEKMGGKVTFNSVLDKGSTFLITVPQAKKSAPKLGKIPANA